MFAPPDCVHMFRNIKTVVCHILCYRMLPDRPEVGYCVQPNSQRVFQIPLQGEPPNHKPRLCCRSCGLQSMHAAEVVATV